MPLYGPKWPLKKGQRDTYELYEDVKSQISFYLKNLLLTSPGENISDPEYGVGLRRYLFENNVDDIRSDISSQISLQISKYLPYLGVLDILVSSDEDQIDNYLLRIKIVYSTPDSILSSVFELDIDQQQTIGFY